MLRIYDQNYILSDLTFKSHCFFWSVSFNKYLFSLSLSLLFFLHDNHLMDLHATQELATNISFLSHANFSSLIWIVFQTPVIQWALNVPLIVVSHACWYYARRCLSSSSYSSSLFSSSSAFFSHLQGKHSRSSSSWSLFVFAGCRSSLYDATLRCSLIALPDHTTRSINPTRRCAWSASNKQFLRSEFYKCSISSHDISHFCATGDIVGCLIRISDPWNSWLLYTLGIPDTSWELRILSYRV